MDGGGASVLRSTLRANDLKTQEYPWGGYFVVNDQNVALCANEQPNFLNRDSCVLSYEEDVCVKEYLDTSRTLLDVQLAVTFDDETLAGMYNATLESRILYAVDGVRWDDTILLNETRPPCALENPVSRWRPRSDLDVATCTNVLAARSDDVLRRALETSNDENPYIRDIYLWNDHVEDGCDEADYDEYGMLVMTSEGCWENMHPDYM